MIIIRLNSIQWNLSIMTTLVPEGVCYTEICLVYRNQYKFNGKTGVKIQPKKLLIQTVMRNKRHRVHLRCLLEPVYNRHPWDHAKWLLYRGGLPIEVASALQVY